MRERAIAPRAGVASLRGRLRMVTQRNHGTFRGWLRCAGSQIMFMSGGLNRFVRPELGQVRRLVFVCLGNIHRSAFAQGVARQRGIEALSYGLAATTGAASAALTVEHAAAFGIDLASHAATDITDYEFAPGDLLLAMEVRHVRYLIDLGLPADAIGLLGHWACPHRIHLQDPHRLSESFLRTCFALIHSAVQHLADELVAVGSPCAALRRTEPHPEDAQHA